MSDRIVLRMRSRWDPRLYWSLWRLRRQYKPEPLTYDPKVVENVRAMLAARPVPGAETGASDE